VCDADMRMFIPILGGFGNSGGDLAATGATFARFRLGSVMEFIVT
jgi:hypothetical protein